MPVWAALGDINAEDNLFVKKDPNVRQINETCYFVQSDIEVCKTTFKTIKLKRKLYSLSFFIFIICFISLKRKFTVNQLSKKKINNKLILFFLLNGITRNRLK